MLNAECQGVLLQEVFDKTGSDQPPTRAEEIPDYGMAFYRLKLVAMVSCLVLRGSSILNI